MPSLMKSNELIGALCGALRQRGLLFNAHRPGYLWHKSNRRDVVEDGILAAAVLSEAGHIPTIKSGHCFTRERYALSCDTGLVLQRFGNDLRIKLPADHQENAAPHAKAQETP